MRQLFEYIRQLVEGRYPNGHSTDTKNDLPRQSVSAFCFLRFIVPAILHPHLFGLCSGTFFDDPERRLVWEQLFRSPRFTRPTKPYVDRKGDSKSCQPEHGGFDVICNLYIF